MRTLYLDTFSGIAGDMFLGLMIDLGVDRESVKRELDKLGLPGYEIDTRTEKRCGIAGTYVAVSIDENQPARTWQDIDSLIAGSGLDPADRNLARRIFRRLGEAEAKIHGIDLEEVHFHEVGAVDSILDIVGGAIAFNRLGVDRIYCAPLPLGAGTVHSNHGEYPLPAPATLEVLKGCPTRPDESGLELVTPTGAVIAAEIATFREMPEMTIESIGYGLGTRDMKIRPNVLRGIIGAVRDDHEHDTVSVIESHLDDCSPEWLGHLMELLFDRGALDVAYTPLQMKKNRPGVELKVISPVALSAELEETVLLNSSAIGVRQYETRRRKLRRETGTVATTLGEATVKLLYAGAKLVRITPEYESCRRLAKASGRPLPEIYRLAEQAAGLLFEPQDEN